MLEVGCGGGVWTKYFVSRGASVTVVEKELHLIEAARLYLQQVSLGCDLVTTMLKPTANVLRANGL